MELEAWALCLASSVEVERFAQVGPCDHQFDHALDVGLLGDEVVALLLGEFEAGSTAVGELDTGAIEDVLAQPSIKLFILLKIKNMLSR